MKLLFDENLSPQLSAWLGDLYPDSVHVRSVGLSSASDQDVWDFAVEHGFAIVSKDSDFHQRSFLFGPPPKVVWIRRGNCTTSEIEQILRSHHADLFRFNEDPEAAFLVLD